VRPGMGLDAWSYADDEWRGYVLVDSVTDLLVRHVFVTWVAGLHFPNAAEHPDFAPGRDLVLRPEPDNPFDPNAIGVWNADATIQAGHLPAVIVRDLSRLPGERHGLVVGEMFEGPEHLGLWVIVAREPITLNLIDEQRAPPHHVKAWVRQAKEVRQRSAAWQELKSGDPLEQMRRMAEGLKDSHQGIAEGPGRVGMKQ